MVSDKYLAGLIDSDGCFDLCVSKVGEVYYVSPRVRITQRALLPIPWSHRVTKAGYNEWSIKGISIINRVKKYLVLKAGQAQWLSQTDISGGHTASNLRRLKAELKAARYKSAVKNFPTRKWLAGYFDGDGCLTAGLRLDRVKPHVAAMITVHQDDVTAVELIQKNFGGCIQRKTPTTFRWDLWLNRTNAEKFLTYFHQHMFLKRKEAELVLDWFRNKHNTCSRESAEVFVQQLRNLKVTRND